MKKTFLLILSLWVSSFTLNGQVIINEILPGGTVELKNIGNAMVNISSYWLCDFPAYQQIQNSEVICGDMMLPPGEILAINNFASIAANDGELGLYSTSSFGSADAILDYVEWGSTGHTRSSVAVAAGIWTTGDFVPAFTSGSSLEYDGEGDASSDWTEQTSETICNENGGSTTCDVIGGTLEGGPFEFCVGDDIVDNVSGITLTGNNGPNNQWIVTDEQGIILGLPPMPGVVNFDGAGAGNCLIWNIAYEDGLEGLEAGLNTGDFEGCFNLSNSIAVVRNQPEGGTLQGGNYEFCVNDGIEDNISGITLTGNSGTNSQWIVTDEQGNILGLPPMPGLVNFDGAGVGTCLIWHLSFEDGLEGAEMGMNANDLEGCYDLSNPISVFRFEDPDCENLCVINGGFLDGEDYTFCVDGEADNVSSIGLSGNTGSNSAWVVTDEQGNILGIPPTPEAVNFDGAGPGTCLIWHLSYEDGLEGLEAGENANNLEGCFDLSNAIRVVRNEPLGGTLEGGLYEFCVNDGVEDNVSGIILTGNTGTNSQWIVTDEQGNILGLPPMPGVVNFDGAGAGTCLIWHLSYEDGLVGAEMGMNANNLEGCFSLSNPIPVYRFEDPDCDNLCTINGGYLDSNDFVFCVDGQVDNVSGVTVEGNTGTNSAWVVTDEQGNILGVPPSPELVNFDDAGTGVCLIWHLSYEDGLEGLEMGMNANNLVGCHDLSNAIRVVRQAPDGGMVNLTDGSTEYTGTAGNIVFDVQHTTTATSLSYWYIITDDNDNILGWLNSADGTTLDLSVAPVGECHVWGWSYRGLGEPVIGENISSLTDDFCEAISDNFITVTRLEDDCLVEGGTLEGGPFEFCVGDGIEDNVSGITLTGNSGANSAWVVTDEQGNILGLPPMPSAVNFDIAGPGTCLIWHLSFEDGLQGAEMGMNANDLVGCFSLSNPIAVVRNQPEGGTLEGGSFEFCVGDGIEDHVSGITLTGNSGSNSAWVVTDEQGNILGLPPMPSAVNFDIAGPGTCLIWHLSFEDGLQGAEMGMNANDLVGCFSLSNPIAVVRLTGDDCNNNNDGVDLELNISVDNATYNQYEHVTYTITATNNGNEDASNIVIEAGLPNGMVYSDDDPSAGDYSLFFEEWRLDELAAGQTETLELVLFTLVKNADIVNFVQVIEQDQDDADSTPGNGNGATPQEDDEAAVTITPANPDPVGGTDADLSLTISVDESTYGQYENVIYTISLTNNGPDDATFIDITAGLPNGMVYSNDNVSHGDYSLFFEEWNIDFLASGETAVLELVLFTLVEGIDITNFVEVIAADQDDPDSTPDNGNGITPQEDDEAAVTITFSESFAGSIQSSGNTFSNNTDTENMSLFPVPTRDQLTVVLNALNEEVINARIIDITGKVMSVNQFTVVNGKNKLELNVNALPNGIYFLNISFSNAKMLNEKFQKVSR